MPPQDHYLTKNHKTVPRHERRIGEILLAKHLARTQTQAHRDGGLVLHSKVVQATELASIGTLQDQELKAGAELGLVQQEDETSEGSSEKEMKALT